MSATETTTAPVTIREHVLGAVAASAPHGLSMSSLTSTIQGSWPEREVKDSIRKMWQIGELARREDGTFVKGRRRINSTESEAVLKSRTRMAQAVTRVAAGAADARPVAPLRSWKVDPTLLQAKCPKCQEPVYQNLDGTCPTCHAQAGPDLRLGRHGRVVKAQPASSAPAEHAEHPVAA